MIAMKLIWLLRHAKSSWSHAGLADLERPLNRRGERAAAIMGRFMRDKHLRPDLVLSSPAVRAKQTTSRLLHAAGLTSRTICDQRIYEASAHRLLEVLAGVEVAADKVLLVGHNPGIEQLVLFLTGADERMPTAALAAITCDIDQWGKLGPRMGQLDWVVRPKALEPH
jgi:phosphohistidine phosphatase